MRTTLHIEVSQELFDRLNKAALERGMTVAELCLTLLSVAEDAFAGYPSILRPGDTP